MNESESTLPGSNPDAAGLLDSTVISCAKDSVYCELEGEAVILSLRDGIYYGLNSVGLRIWELIQQPRTICAIVDVLIEEYDVEREECHRGVIDLVRELREKALIDVTEAL